MLIGRRTEKLAEPSRSEVLERGRSRTLIVTPGSGDATGNNLGKPNQGRQRQAVKSVFEIWFRNIRASTYLSLSSQAKAERLCKTVAVCSSGRLQSAVDTSSLSGHRDPATPCRCLQCTIVTFGLLKVSQREFPMASGSASPVPQ